MLRTDPMQDEDNSGDEDPIFPPSLTGLQSSLDITSAQAPRPAESLGTERGTEMTLSQVRVRRFGVI